MIDFPSSGLVDGQQFAAPNGAIYQWVAASSYWKLVFPLTTNSLSGQIIREVTLAAPASFIALPNLITSPAWMAIDVLMYIWTGGTGSDQLNLQLTDSTGTGITGGPGYTMIWNWSSASGPGTQVITSATSFGISSVTYAGGVGAAGRILFTDFARGTGQGHYWWQQPGVYNIIMQSGFMGPTSSSAAARGLYFYSSTANNIATGSKVRVIGYPLT